MPDTLNWSFKAQVSEGLSVNTSGKLDLTAHGKISATATPGTTTVNVQPGDGGQFLLIMASKYEDLSYVVDGAGDPITLDGAHILIGSGAVTLLGSTQQTFVFTNVGSEDITITILVGRDASS